MRVPLSSPLWIALLVTGLSVFVQGKPAAKGDRVLAKDVQKPRLAVLPLLPGDSPEARRRRRQRRQRRLDSEGGEETTNTLEEAENENPLEVYRDVLYEGYGVHYVDLWVGCPTPQRVTVIVDTGSSVTGFPCQDCHHCGGDADSNDEHKLYHTDQLFRQGDSTCFEAVTSPTDCLVGTWNDEDKSCRTSKHYSEGSSWDAFEAMDQVYTGGDHNSVDVQRETKDSFRLHFGCQDSVTGLFETQVRIVYSICMD